MDRPVGCHGGIADRRSPTPALAGAGEVLPLLAGYVPFALVIGVTVAAGSPLLARWLSTVLILGGSAQLVTLELLDAGSSLALVIGAGLVTNARLLAYSASLAPDWRVQPRWFRIVAAALLIDPSWALARRHLATGPSARDHRAYYLGASLTLTGGWLGIVSVGVAAGEALTDTLGSGGLLALAGPLSLAALIAPQLFGRAAVAATATAAATGWLTAGWPAGTGLLAAITAATAVGAVLDRDPGDPDDPDEEGAP